MTRRSAAEQAEWERVAAYHDAELRTLIERLREGLARLDRGEIDPFEFDELVHHYKRATQKLWSFCVGGGSHIRSTARHLEYLEKEDDKPDWWEIGAPRRRRD